MPMYRMEKSWDGSHRIRSTSADQEIGSAVGTAIGWALTAGTGGVTKVVSRTMRERKARRLMEEFEAATAAGDGGQMLRAADGIVRRWPSEDYGHELRARALMALERSADAVAALDRAVQLGMDPYEANVGRAAAYEMGGQTGKAIQEYTALVNHPESAEARAAGLLGRAMCLVELEDLDQALNDVNQAIATQPGRGCLLRARRHPPRARRRRTMPRRLGPRHQTRPGQRRPPRGPRRNARGARPRGGSRRRPGDGGCGPRQGVSPRPCRRPIPRPPRRTAAWCGLGRCRRPLRTVNEAFRPPRLVARATGVSGPGG